ncbi:MAG: dephospho-CoA kinase [Bdellovibrionales bacterium]|nr:dephospho-CoA kinase [Bdellovibrionales bacterium]
MSSSSSPSSRKSASSSSLHPFPQVIAVTGGIASGKSTVSRLLGEAGLFLVSADRVARDVVIPGSHGLQKIIAHFGEGFLDENGALNRAKLGKHVFQNPSAREALEKILHPLIRDRVRALIKQGKEETALRPIVYEVPLYFETGYDYPEVDQVVVVYAPKELSVQRLIARDGLSAEEAQQRVAAQMDIEEKKVKADYVIENTGSLELLESAVRALLPMISEPLAV